MNLEQMLRDQNPREITKKLFIEKEEEIDSKFEEYVNEMWDSLKGCCMGMSKKGYYRVNDIILDPREKVADVLLFEMDESKDVDELQELKIYYLQSEERAKRIIEYLNSLSNAEGLKTTFRFSKFGDSSNYGDKNIYELVVSPKIEIEISQYDENHYLIKKGSTLNYGLIRFSADWSHDK